jgi:hypothetical protein
LPTLRQDEYYSAGLVGGIMLEFAIVPMREAQASTTAGRQGRFMHEYIQYIRQLPQARLASFTLGSMKILSPSDGG